MIISYSMQVLNSTEEEGKVSGLTEDEFSVLQHEQGPLRKQEAKAYEATEWVDFDNKYMRHDDRCKGN